MHDDVDDLIDYELVLFPGKHNPYLLPMFPPPPIYNLLPPPPHTRYRLFPIIPLHSWAPLSPSFPSHFQCSLPSVSLSPLPLPPPPHTHTPSFPDDLFSLSSPINKLNKSQFKPAFYDIDLQSCDMHINRVVYNSVYITEVSIISLKCIICQVSIVMSVEIFRWSLYLHSEIS